MSRWVYFRRIFTSYILQAGSSNLSFWHTPLKINRLSQEEINILRAYPQNFEGKIGLIQTRDDQGVIILDYKGSLGLQYNPNAVAQLALGYYDRIMAGEDRKRDFLNQAAFFLEHGRYTEDGILLWEYDFPFEMRNYMYPPWRSALAQGQGISVCLRAYQVSGDERYLDAARQAFNSFRHLSRENPGGVLDDSHGYIWLEEYIVNPPNHILNGFVWALWGVRDYAVFFNDKYAWKLWKACLKTLKENLHYYDLGFWTSYDFVSMSGVKQPTMPSSLYYQKLHIVQMQAMYSLTNDQIFDFYARKWQAQLDNILYRLISQVWKAYFKLRWF